MGAVQGQTVRRGDFVVTYPAGERESVCTRTGRRGPHHFVTNSDHTVFVCECGARATRNSGVSE